MGRELQVQAARRQKTTRTTIRAVSAVIVIVAIFFVIAFITKDDSNDSAATTTTVATADSTAPSSVAPAEFTYGTTECAPVEGTAEPVREFSDSFALCIDPTKTYTATVTTNFGVYTAVLDAAKAPGTVNNFVNLARSKYYDDTTCHRAIPEFVVQCGDPTASGSGGPGYQIADELPAAGEYQVGSLAMANSGPNSNGSQFFVITGPDGAALPPDYTLFGQVTDGLDTTVFDMNLAGNDDPAANGVPPKGEIKIVSITITES